MITIEKFFCCIELKWGALIIGIVELIFCCCLGGLCGGIGMEIVYYLLLIVSILHIIACILIIVSVFVPKKELVILYLITALIRFIVLLICIIWMLCVGANAVGPIVIMVISLVLAVYFWLCIYSWFKELGGSTPVD